ncbi:MAG: hypothetical protein KJZ85_11850 [Rhodobacteraceae bacterium]|nr:hypothetical protein [Paracoccaceae bacterium]
MRERTSRMAHGAVGMAMAGLLGVLSTAAAAQDSTAPGTGAPEAAVTSRGSAGDYIVVTADDVFTFESNEYEAVPGMSASVFAERRSNLIVTFTAECVARPNDPDSNAAVRVRVLVDGDPAPGPADLLLCSNKQFYVETHSFTWVVPVAAKRRREVSVEAAYFPGSNGDGLLADRVLRIDYDSAR